MKSASSGVSNSKKTSIDHRLACKTLTNSFVSISFQILLKIGISVYEALDFNLPQDEECILSQDLHDLISLMTFEGN